MWKLDYLALMKLKRTPELLNFLTTYIANGEMDADDAATRSFAEAAPSDTVERVLAQARTLADDTEIPLDELGSEANRWFGDADEARAWVISLVEVLGSTSSSSDTDSTVTKDSNGAILLEGDSVQVVKDLKVKGGSSDLKRGTLIKKIHLIGDPGNIECRVDGSTLVLKTMFLKKV